MFLNLILFLGLIRLSTHARPSNTVCLLCLPTQDFAAAAARGEVQECSAISYGREINKEVKEDDSEEGPVKALRRQDAFRGISYVILSVELV